MLTFQKFDCIDNMTENKNTTPILFHFASLYFEAYKDVQKSSSGILRDVMNFIRKEKTEKRGVVVDRHFNRPNDPPREIFMTNVRFEPKKSRIKCSIALLRAGRIPKIKKQNELELTSFDETIGTIAEETHFFIDYSQHKAVMCVEFNYNGPRLLDIEFYLRSLAWRKLRLSKKTEVSVIMDSTIDDTIKNLKNVLNIEVKANPKSITQMDNDIKGYFTGITSMGQKLNPKFVKLEVMYQTSGVSVSNSKNLNDSANRMVLDVLRKIVAKPYHLDCFEQFEVKYVDRSGAEQLFQLLNGKKELKIDIDLKKTKNVDQWYKLIEVDFDKVIEPS